MTDYDITVTRTDGEDDEVVELLGATEEPTPPETGDTWTLEDGVTEITLAEGDPVADTASEILVIDPSIDPDDTTEETTADCQNPAGYKLVVVMNNNRSHTFYSPTPLSPPAGKRWWPMKYNTDFKLSQDRKSYVFITKTGSQTTLNISNISSFTNTPMPKPPGCP